MYTLSFHTAKTAWDLLLLLASVQFTFVGNNEPVRHKMALLKQIADWFRIKHGLGIRCYKTNVKNVSNLSEQVTCIKICKTTAILLYAKSKLSICSFITTSFQVDVAIWFEVSIEHWTNLNLKPNNYVYLCVTDNLLDRTRGFPVRMASKTCVTLFKTHFSDLQYWHRKYVLSYAMLYTSRHKHTVHQATKPVTRWRTSG